jgi:hypothetical protein
LRLLRTQKVRKQYHPGIPGQHLHTASNHCVGIVEGDTGAEVPHQVSQVVSLLRCATLWEGKGEVISAAAASPLCQPDLNIVCSPPPFQISPHKHT